MNVYVVTRPDLGWDCVVGCFIGVSKEDLELPYPEGDYVISEVMLQTELDKDY